MLPRNNILFKGEFKRFFYLKVESYWQKIIDFLKGLKIISFIKELTVFESSHPYFKGGFVKHILKGNNLYIFPHYVNIISYKTPNLIS